MSELRDRVQAALGSNCTVERELGGGGMGRVFVAKDETLGRRVVVKVLPAEAGADVSIERFKREIQFAAQLQHAHIVPLLTAGDAGGAPYYVMPFIAGESLRVRIGRGTVPMPEATGVMKDVARALMFAHEHGVVHRDIKPDNILLAGGAAVVTDFGIAKAVTAAMTSGGVDQATITSIGTVIGTPAYMAPEQCLADPDTDHRADIYAFGCVAYEILTGAPPFGWRTTSQLFTAHLTETPQPLVEKRKDCPSQIAALVHRCLEKDPAHRPQSAREILDALDGVATPVSPPLRAPARRWWIGAVAAATAAALAATVILGDATRGTQAGDTAQLLTVLPFLAPEGDTVHEYLAEGISEELATALGRTQGIRVVGRTAANRFRGQRDVDVRDVGDMLGVSLVVQGSVRPTPAGIRVYAQLTNASTREELWSDTYQRGSAEALALRDDIARSITDVLRQRVSAAVGAAPAAGSQGSADPEAYDLYLRGQYLVRRRAVAPAIENFRLAIARDPGFARAHAGLSAALALSPYFAQTPAPRVYDEVLRVASRALALDSTLAEPHTSLGLAYMHAGDWGRAHEEHKIAVRLEPQDHSAHLQYGRFLVYSGVIDSALAEFRRAKAIDPFSAVYSGWVAHTLWLLDSGSAAVAEMDRALQLDSLNPPTVQAEAKMAADSGLTARARAAARRLPPFAPWNGVAAHIFGRIGDREAAQQIVRSIEQQRPRPWFGETALAYAALGTGDTAAALGALERATAAGEYWAAWFSITESQFDAVRASPRFRELVRRTGLDERAARQAPRYIR